MLKGFNDLATTHPEIASEWSEKNLPFKPDAVNAKSRENVWWKCSKCGNEWKSVINIFISSNTEEDVRIIRAKTLFLMIATLDGTPRFLFYRISKTDKEQNLVIEKEQNSD